MKKRSRRRQSRPTADTFMTDKADAGQASTVAVAAAEGLVRASWHSVAVLLPVPFVLESTSAGFFKSGDVMRHQVLWFSIRVDHQQWYQKNFLAILELLFGAPLV